MNTSEITLNEVFVFIVLFWGPKCCKCSGRVWVDIKINDANIMYSFCVNWPFKVTWLKRGRLKDLKWHKKHKLNPYIIDKMYYIFNYRTNFYNVIFWGNRPHCFRRDLWGDAGYSGARTDPGEVCRDGVGWEQMYRCGIPKWQARWTHGKPQLMTHAHITGWKMPTVQAVRLCLAAGILHYSSSTMCRKGWQTNCTKHTIWSRCNTSKA